MREGGNRSCLSERLQGWEYQLRPDGWLCRREGLSGGWQRFSAREPLPWELEGSMSACVGTELRTDRSPEVSEHPQEGWAAREAPARSPGLPVRFFGSEFPYM